MNGDEIHPRPPHKPMRRWRGWPWPTSSQWSELQLAWNFLGLVVAWDDYKAMATLGIPMILIHTMGILSGDSMG